MLTALLIFGGLAQVGFAAALIAACLMIAACVTWAICNSGR